MKLILKTIPAVGLLAAFGCATHTSESETARNYWAAGNVAEAQREVAAKAADKCDSGDSLIWTLELGSVSRANGDFPQSIKAFSKAHSDIEAFENEPDVKLSEEAAAIFTNQSYIPYKGYNYDKIMVGVYQALNYMESKDFDSAAVELKRLENFQRNAEEANRSRIEREEKALKEAQAKNKGGGYDANKTLSDPGASAKLKEIYGDDYMADTSAMEAKSIYMNPFAYWVSGLFFMNKAEDGADRNKAADFFRLAAEMTSNKSEFLLSDLKTAEDYANGAIAGLPDTTYVIYETGSAPIRKQVRLDLPLYIIQGDIPHVGMNFPYLAKNDSYVADITVAAADQTSKTELLADMDAIIRREFNNELPSVITKTIISSAVKAAAQYGVKQAAGDGWGGLAVNLVGSVYQASMNDADLRTWTTLPKQIRVAKVKNPADGMLLVDGKLVKVNPKGVNVVVAKRPSAVSPLLVRTFDFSAPKGAQQ